MLRSAAGDELKDTLQIGLHITKKLKVLLGKKVILGDSMDHPPWLLQPGMGWCDCPDMRTLRKLGRGNYFN